MKRTLFIHILVLTATAASTAVLAQETRPGRALDWSQFQAIGQKNIFDPTRGPGLTEETDRPRPKVVRTFTCRGTMDDRAIFTGEGAPDDRGLKAGDTINGFKILQVTVDTVKLADPSGNIIDMQADDSMRREEDGPWTKSDEPPPMVVDSSSGPTLSTPGAVITPGGGPSETAASAGGGSESDVLKRLRLRREQEDK